MSVTTKGRAGTGPGGEKDPGDAVAVREISRSAGPRRGPMAGGIPAEKAQNFLPSARRLVARLVPHRARMVTVLALAVVSVALSVSGPRIIGRATDIIFNGWASKRVPAGTTKAEVIARLRAQGDNRQADLFSRIDLHPGRGIDVTALGHVLMLALVIYVFASLFAWLQGWLLAGVVNQVVVALRDEVEAKLNRLPLAYFDKQPRGEVLSRVTNDIDNVSQSLQQTLSQLLISLLTVIGVVVMMLTISPLLTLVVLVTIPISLYVTKRVAARSQGQFIKQWKATGQLNGQVEEFYTGHALVKVFGRQREMAASFSDTNTRLYEAGYRAQFVSGIIMPSMMFIGNLIYVAVAVIGGLWVAAGTVTLGSIQAFIQYSRQFTQPMSQVASMANLLQSGVASAERVFEILDEPEQVPDPVAADTVPAAQSRGRVQFEHVRFSYLPDRPLIQDLSLTAEPGHTVAIVGPTGAGKTTLVNLILRFYELQGGRITLDGVDIARMRRDDLRSRIGMVLQDTWLFGGTIRENIAYGRPGANEDEIVEAATATYVDRFVRSLPDGYDTVIDSEGSNVSAGERQLITIARAFLSDPALLILDEATSSVDTRTEVLVQHAMAALRSDRTSFVIAHRLSTIRDAHLILMMQDGAIVEQGTHDQLIEAGGAYYRLYQSQFAAGADDGLEGATGAGALTGPAKR